MNSDDEISDEGKHSRVTRWEKIGVDRIKADLLAGGHQLVGGPPAVRDLAWKWVRDKEAQKPEVVTLKPGYFGFSIDLKEIGRRVVRRFKEMKNE